MDDIDEMVAPERMADVIDPLPDWAHSSWCLPGYAGTVVIRGYDTYKSTLEDLDIDGVSDRWGLDETRIPTTAETAANVHGPCGEITVGDCVVFVGIAEGSNDPIVWFPQRIVAVDRPRAGWQRVWAVRDMEANDEGPIIEPAALGKDITIAEPLRGDTRRRVLEHFSLNVECPLCAGRGGVIEYDHNRVPIAPDEFTDPRPRGDGDPTYACYCGASWTVNPDGTVEVNEPLPIL